MSESNEKKPHYSKAWRDILGRSSERWEHGKDTKKGLEAFIQKIHTLQQILQEVKEFTEYLLILHNYLRRRHEKNTELLAFLKEGGSIIPARDDHVRSELEIEIENYALVLEVMSEIEGWLTKDLPWILERSEKIEEFIKVNWGWATHMAPQDALAYWREHETKTEPNLQYAGKLNVDKIPGTKEAFRAALEGRDGRCPKCGEKLTVSWTDLVTGKELVPPPKFPPPDSNTHPEEAQLWWLKMKTTLVSIKCPACSFPKFDLDAAQ